MAADTPTPAAPRAFAEMAELTGLATRIAQAIAAAEAAPPEALPRAIVFRVGPLRAALPLSAIREVVVPPEQVSRIPRGPEALLGIMNLRGRVIAVVDLLFALPPEVTVRLTGAAQASRTTLGNGQLLILERNRREVGLLVTSVEGIAPIRDLDGNDPTLLDPNQLARAIEALVG